MALIPVQKIQIIGLRKHQKVLLGELQKKESFHVMKNELFDKFSEHNQAPKQDVLVDEALLSRIEFAINFLMPHAPKPLQKNTPFTGGLLSVGATEASKKMESFSPKLVSFLDRCEFLQAEKVKQKNQLTAVGLEIAKQKIFSGSSFRVEESLKTELTHSYLGRMSLKKYEEFLSEISKKSVLFEVKKIATNSQQVVFRATVFQSFQVAFSKLIDQFKIELIDFDLQVSTTKGFLSEITGKTISEILEELHLYEKKLNESILDIEKEIQTKATFIQELKIAYDFSLWERDKLQAQENSFETKNLFLIEGWMEKNLVKDFQQWVTKGFGGEIEIEILQTKEEERAPALLKNKGINNAFEIVTKMFGAPNKDDLDPTPFMTPFFIIFFGISLSDAGYGLILSVIAGIFYFRGKLASVRTPALMILMCGLSATLGGVLLGGWFGMSTEVAPAFLLSASGGFKGQILDTLSGMGPMTFLLFSFGVGVFQALVGIFADGLRKIKNKDYFGAFADNFSWILLLGGTVLWAVAEQVGLPKNVLGVVALVGAGIIFLTNGRKKKNIFAKIVFGILGLYGIMDHVSNILSYSRLMALGLATGIIGGAMNTTAGVLGGMIPGVGGIALAIFFLAFGHSLNMGLSTLGAYIHSMRLQFIEFFGLFYTGGSPLFVPLKKVKKYVWVR